LANVSAKRLSTLNKTLMRFWARIAPEPPKPKGGGPGVSVVQLQQINNDKNILTNDNSQYTIAIQTINKDQL
jgi:hypothetical protein